MIIYSLSLIAGYSIAKWVTPRSPKLLTKHFHIHHWIWATFFLVAIFISTYFIDNELNNWVIGLATGVGLQGLSYLSDLNKDRLEKKSEKKRIAAEASAAAADEEDFELAALIASEDIEEEMLGGEVDTINYIKTLEGVGKKSREKIERLLADPKPGVDLKIQKEVNKIRGLQQGYLDVAAKHSDNTSHHAEIRNYAAEGYRAVTARLEKLEGALLSYDSIAANPNKRNTRRGRRK
jgi:hypothetical protein